MVVGVQENNDNDRCTAILMCTDINSIRCTDIKLIGVQPLYRCRVVVLVVDEICYQIKSFVVCHLVISLGW